MATPCIDARLSESRVTVLQVIDGRTGASGNPTTGYIGGDRRSMDARPEISGTLRWSYSPFCRGLMLTP